MIAALFCLLLITVGYSLPNAHPPILKHKDKIRGGHNKKALRTHASESGAREDESLMMLPSSCVGLEDGYHWLKLLEDTEDTTYPMVYAKCSNEFVLIDFSTDENWSSYFTTWYKYHYAVAGPSRNEEYNWPEWFLPDATRLTYTGVLEQRTVGSGSYRVSPSCGTCDSSDMVNFQLNDDQSAYYMSALAFGCFDPTRGWPACDMDYDTYECKLCEWDDDGTQISSSIRPITMTYEEVQHQGLKAGVCDFNIRSATQAIEDSYSKCAIEGSPNINWKPSLGLEGTFCQCWKPDYDYTSNVEEEEASDDYSADEIAPGAPGKDQNENRKDEQYGNDKQKQDENQSRKDEQYGNDKRNDKEKQDSKAAPESDSNTHPHHIAVNLAEYDRRVMEREFPKQEEPAMPSSEDSVYQLWQSDFEDGTYRITESGTYILMEDIELNFNAAPDNVESPNNYVDDYWWPTDSDAYPGAGEARDPYFLGYFAGITVEVDNVVIDLNSKEIKMAKAFYYQQPYFSIIELESQPFLPQQGPGFFGADPIFASNVVIKNGVIGLSSHHAIHGNWNNDVTIEDIRVKDFQTHGIQLNGFERVEVRNVEIGPTTEIAYLNGNYGHMRLIIPILEQVAEDSDSATPNTIWFKGRESPVSMWDLLDKLIVEMDMAFKFVMTGETFEDHPYWQEAQDMFINPSGLPYGAVLYGLFLNYPSAGIFGWHVNNALSYNATVENVYIHDLRHKGIEVVGFQSGGRVFCNAFNGPLPALDTFGTDDVWNVQHALYYETDRTEYEMQYHGSIVTDIWLAQYFWGSINYDYWPGIPYLGKHDLLIEWATGTNDDYLAQNEANMYFSCNEDAMFHPSKGLLGFKASGTDGMTVSGLRIENIQDETPLGSDLCGHQDTYHFSQQEPYQVGYSMNMVMGISMDFMTNTVLEDITMDKLVSDTGLVFGLAAWFESEIEVRGHFGTKGLLAGYSIEDETFDYDSRPNKAPESCSLRLYDDDSYPLSMSYAEDLIESQTCMKGAVGCLGEDYYTGYGTAHMTSEDDSCDTTKAFEYAPTEVSEVLPRILQSVAEEKSKKRDQKSEVEQRPEGEMPKGEESGFVVMNGVNKHGGRHHGISGKEVSFVTLVLAIAAVAVCTSMKALWDCRLKELKSLNANGSYRPLLKYLISDSTESTPLITGN